MNELEFLEELKHRMVTNSEITFDNKNIIFPLEIYDKWIDNFMTSRMKEINDPKSEQGEVPITKDDLEKSSPELDEFMETDEQKIKKEIDKDYE